MVDYTPQRQKTDSSNPINKLVEAILGTATQHRRQTSSAIFKPATSNSLIFDGKNKKFELFDDIFQTMLKMQPEMSEAMKLNLFHSHLQKDALKTFRNMNASNKRTI